MWRVTAQILIKSNVHSPDVICQYSIASTPTEPSVFTSTAPELKPVPSESSKTAQAAGQTTTESWFVSWQDKRLHFSRNRTDRLWGSPSLVFNGFQGFFPLGQCYRTVKLTTHLNPQPRSRIVEVIPVRSSQPVDMLLVSGNLSGSSEEQEHFYNDSQISSDLVRCLRNYCFFKFITVKCPKRLCRRSCYYQYTRVSQMKTLNIFYLVIY